LQLIAGRQDYLLKMEEETMPNYSDSTIPLSKPTLALWGVRAFAFQALLICAAVVLPVAAHLSGAPVRILLPMHWPVILAGLVYGWRSGALIGFLAPIVSYLLSGFPLPHILPSMTLELLTYGLGAGVLREVLHLNPFISAAIALLLGRIVFILSVLLSGAVAANQLEYFQAALLPGLVAAVCQIALLPLLAEWWIRQEKRRRMDN
jgi:niacin transporter